MPEYGYLLYARVPAEDSPVDLAHKIADALNAAGTIDEYEITFLGELSPETETSDEVVDATILNTT